MDDNKKSALLKAANKLKNAKKNVSNDGTKSVKPNNARGGDELTSKIKDAVSKFDRD